MTEIQTLPAFDSPKGKIVVLTPHPDDESLGCGILLAEAFQNARAHVICMTDGSASHPGSALSRSGELARIRQNELITAITRLGGSARDLTWMGLPDAELYRCDKAHVATKIGRVIDGLGATSIFAPSPDDHHEDHKVTASIARLLRMRRPDLSYYSYPLWSRWDDPGFEQTIAKYCPRAMKAGENKVRKVAAIHAHRSQMGQVVTDDPLGYRLSREFIGRFTEGDEIFWEMA